MYSEVNANNEARNDLAEIRPFGFEHGLHREYMNYSQHYRNPFLGYGFIAPFAGGLLGGLAAGALFNSNTGHGYGGYPSYYGGYPPYSPYPSYYYGGYGYPYWRNS